MRTKHGLIDFDDVYVKPNVWRQLGLSRRWLDGAVRQQCAGHLPFERQRLKLGERLQAVLSIDCTGAVADAAASLTNGLVLLRSSRPGHEVV